MMKGPDGKPATRLRGGWCLIVLPTRTYEAATRVAAAALWCLCAFVCVCVFVICECAGERALGARTTDEGHGRRFLSGHLSLAKRRRSVRARRRRLVRPWTFRPV